MNKDISIIAQVAGKIAGNICHGKGYAGLAEYAATCEFVFNDLLDKSGFVAGAEIAVAPTPVDQVVAAFTTPAGVAPTVVPAAPAVAPAVATIPVQGGSGHTPGPAKTITTKSSMIDMLEDAIFHNPANWKRWDSEKSSLQGGRSADITHEQLKNDRGYSLGIWLVDSKFGKNAPEWAFLELGHAAKYAGLVASGVIQP